MAVEELYSIDQSGYLIEDFETYSVHLDNNNIVSGVLLPSFISAKDFELCRFVNVCGYNYLCKDENVIKRAPALLIEKHERVSYRNTEEFYEFFPPHLDQV